MSSIIREFFRKPRVTGALAPSSRFLARRMASALDPSSALQVVELGPGTGSITAHLLERLGATARLTLIETNEEFVKKLWALTDPRLSVFHACAQDLNRFVARADAIVSGVPLGSLPDAEAEQILKSVSQVPGLKMFVQFQYTKRRDALFRKYFDVRRERVLLNMPPAFVYVCTPKISSVNKKKA